MQKTRYSDEEIAIIRQKFNVAMVRNLNQQRNMFLGVGAILACGVLLYLILPGSYSNPIVVFFIVVFGIYLFAISRLYPPLKCPGCHSRLEDSFGNFCPACGGSPFKIIDDYQGECTNCNSYLKLPEPSKGGGVGRRFRNFKIKACTRCGVTLTRGGF